jgi:imidazolonepropionase-like amidohydrolase
LFQKGSPHASEDGGILSQIMAVVLLCSMTARAGEKTLYTFTDGTEGIRWAAEAGVDSIEHGSYIDDAGIAAMKEHGTYLVPTLYLGDWMIDNAGLTRLPPPLLAKAQAAIPAARKNIAHAFASGVKVAFGTDAAVYPHGMNAHEFAVMVKLGLTPLQAIQAATVNAADLLGWAGKVGTLEPGSCGRRGGGW